MIGVIKRLSVNLPHDALSRICRSFIEPYLDYSKIIYIMINQIKSHLKRKLKKRSLQSLHCNKWYYSRKILSFTPSTGFRTFRRKKYWHWKLKLLKIKMHTHFP